MTAFHHILVNNAIASVTNFTVWFALTFWVFLETRSVLATGMIAGIYLVLTAGLGIWLGSLVDRHGKTAAMAGSSAASLLLYAAAAVVYILSPEGSLRTIAAPHLWLFVLIVMLGVIAGTCAPSPCRRWSRCCSPPTPATRPTGWSAWSTASASSRPRRSAAS